MFLILETFAIPHWSFLGSLVCLMSPGSTWWAAQLWAHGWSGGPRKNGTKGFLCTPHHRSSPGNALESPLTLLHFRLGSHLRRHPPHSEHTSAAFGFRKSEKQCFELPRTKYFQNFISTGKLKLLQALLQSRMKTVWKCQDFPQKENAKFWPTLALSHFFKKTPFFNLII